MAIIQCPECGGKVSSEAPACIHCGYPLQEHTPASASKKVIIQSMSLESKIGIIRVVREETGLGLADAKSLVEQSLPVVIKDGLTDSHANDIARKLNDAGADAKVCNSSEPISFASASKDKDIIVCPRCGSTQYHAGTRGFSLITGFIGSGKTVLTCLKCGHRWKPGR